MGLLVQILPTVLSVLFGFGGNVEHGLRPEEEPTAFTSNTASKAKMLVEVGLTRAEDEVKFLVPPSGLKPALMAMASISVDLPEPLSPTRNVTARLNSSRGSVLTAGMANG